MSAEELLSRTRKHLWAAWALSSEEIGSQAAATLLGLGMLVPEGGAAELESLRARVAELEAERHSTNEALDDAAKALRANRDRIAELEQHPTIGDVVAWLSKKAREYRYPTARERHESAADAIARLADKASRGAIRPSAPAVTARPLEDPHESADCKTPAAATSPAATATSTQSGGAS